jgi:hypothetical protein
MKTLTFISLLCFSTVNSFAQELSAETKQMMKQQSAIEEKYAKEEINDNDQFEAKKSALKRELQSKEAQLSRNATGAGVAAVHAGQNAYTTIADQYLEVQEMKNLYEVKKIPELELEYEKKRQEREMKKTNEIDALGMKYLPTTTPDEVKMKKAAEQGQKIEAEYRPKFYAIDNKKRQEMINSEFEMRKKIGATSVKLQKLQMELMQKHSESSPEKPFNFMNDPSYQKLDNQRIAEESELQKKLDDISRKYDKETALLELEKSKKLKSIAQ